MDKLTCKKLFQADQHENRSGTGNEKGSGLGLILTKDFIELLGGTVKVESEIDQGTALTISFPNTLAQQKNAKTD
jgi:signal transduction histidine kinase